MNNPEMRKKPYWLFYYSLPALFSIFAIYLFITLFDKNLFCAGDGWVMQYTAAEYAREFWRHVLTGSWTAIDFTIGEGMDPLISMAYYGLTDPMTLLTVPFSKEALPAVYNVLTLFKLYFSGVMFGLYATTKSKDHHAIAMGALTYAFSGFMVLWLFSSGILSTGYLFPLLLYAIDKAFDKQKYTMFAWCTVFAYLTNYYAAAIVSCMLMVYAVLRIFMAKHWDKATLFSYSKIVFAHLIGILSASFVLIPIAFALSGGSRGVSAGYADSMLWFNVEYYLDLLISLFTPFTNAQNYWVSVYKSLTHFICIAAPSLILFLKHKTTKGSSERLLKWCLLIATCFMCIPVFSKLLNMWMYATHRWAFAASMVIGMIVVWAVPHFATMGWKTKIASAVCLIGGACATLLNMYPRGAIMAIIGAVIASAIMLIKPRKMTAYIATALSLIMFITSTFVGNAYSTQFCFENIEEQENHTFYAAVTLSDEELEQFIRVGMSNNRNDTNAGTLLGYNTTTAVWNIMPAEVCEYNSSINAFPNMETDWWSDGWDNRTALYTLAGTQYYIIDQKQDMFAPYGFSLYKTVTIDTPERDTEQVTCNVYTNDYNPGVGYVFDNTLSTEAFEKLDIAQKQAALMKYAVTDNSDNNTADVTTFEVPHTVTKSDGKISLQAVIPEGYEVYLEVDKIVQLPNSNQVKVHGYQSWQAQQNIVGSTTSASAKSAMNTDHVAYVEVTNAAGQTAQKMMRAQRAQAHLVTSNSNRIVCLGHQLAGDTTIDIIYLPEYVALNNIKLYAMQTSEYTTSALKLKESAWQNVEYSKRGDNSSFISGTVTTETNGVFQVAVPYSSGWKAYVDGQEVPVFVSGIKYMGIEVSAGKHEIRFEYSTPGLITGTVLSTIFIMLLLVWSLHERGIFERIYTPKRKSPFQEK